MLLSCMYHAAADARRAALPHGAAADIHYVYHRLARPMTAGMGNKVHTYRACYFDKARRGHSRGARARRVAAATRVHCASSTAPP